MICSNCGNAIDDNAAVCVHCGVATPLGMTMGVGGTAKAPADPNEPANGGFIFLSLLIPMFGIIYGAIEKGNGKERAGKAYLTSGIAAMIFWLVFAVVITLFSVLLPFLIMIPVILSETH